MPSVNQSSKRYSNYDPLARIYNHSWAPPYCKQFLTPLDQLLLQNLPKGAQILDLCCGTGQVAGQLLIEGYQVTGLDGSEAMLHYARENAPKGEFILGDARCFNLPSTFHAVISTNASLNHVMSLEELQGVFRNVYTALRDKGMFLLSIFLEEHFYSDAWKGNLTGGEIKEEYAWAIQQSYNLEEKIGVFKVTIFQLLEGNWQRSDISYQYKAYSRTEVKSALEYAGFTEVSIYDAKGNLAEIDYEGDAIFVCHKT
ncbi:MAG: class I SAM-dependent methyltransferase [Coleofasciculus sp. S288]|nr:class I SAM-dependent methyltransferase [Coleofasciculus sp. S288]